MSDRLNDDAPAPATELLRSLVAEIAAGDYRDPLGHPLVLNTAYLAALATLQLGDALEQPR